MKTRAKGKKWIKWAVLGILALAAAFVGFVVVDNLLYMREMTDKERNLVEYRSPDGGQEVFLLGTIHGRHFERGAGYSLADVQSVIDRVDPDLLLLEVRPESIERYGVLDGPAEMIFGWAYAQQQGLPAAGVDWWEIEPGSRSNSTTPERDDRMFERIQEASAGYGRVLVLCGATHRINQSQRFEKAGWQEVELDGVSSYFAGGAGDGFVYPAGMRAELEKKIEYCGAGMRDEIGSSLPEGKERQQWLAQCESLEASLRDIAGKLVDPGKLYWE